MDENFIFTFKTALSGAEIPDNFNNPFGGDIPEIGRLAAREFQNYIASASQGWSHDFRVQKGKMFGVLVVVRKDQTLGYIGTISGKLNGAIACDKLVPSAFDDTADQTFIHEGMHALSEMGKAIQLSDNHLERSLLQAIRKQKSLDLQRKLFEHYVFMNLSGQSKNILEIFSEAGLANPPAATGDCAAPKLLHFAFKHGLRPIALAEFWWGNTAKHQERVHKGFYPACTSKCKPVLEYMLEDHGLYHRAKVGFGNWR